MKSYRGIGLMSGTSMDGVDMAYCDFYIDGEKFSFDLLASRSIAYDERWHRRLFNLMEQSAEVYAKTDVYFGHFLGKTLQAFIEEENPAALREIAERLQEAIDRGLWTPRSNSARMRIDAARA